MPDPNASSISVVAAATKAPAMMDGHEAADLAGKIPAFVAALPAMIVSAMSIQRCEHMASRRMIGRGTPNSQSSIPRPMLSPLR
jgi:hypothetical protein